MTTPRTLKRDAASLRRHFEIEHELAERLKVATPDARKAGLYREVYNELFNRVPDHPQHTRRDDPAETDALTRRELHFLGRFLTPDSTYLEVGPGDCHLAIAVADRVRRVYAVDVSDVIATGAAGKMNFTLILSDGVSVDVPAGCADVAYSNQLMEHLHPDDAAEQLRHLHRALAPGGKYVCVTPHRFSGPHDISQFYSTEPQGFHLREYTFRELARLFRAAGFGPVRIWVGVKGRWFVLPKSLVTGVESLLGLLPPGLRRGLARRLPLRAVFTNLTIVGHKGA